MSEEEKTATPAQKSGLGSSIAKALLVVVLVLVASAGGGIVSWVLISRSGVLPGAAAQEPAHEEGVDLRELMEKGAVVTLEPFVVNLADTDSPRYLRVSISLMIDDKKIVNEVLENTTMLSKTRDVILQTLSRKKSQEIIDEAGKNHLRAEILERLEPFYHKPKVVDVMFTEFVIQL